VLLSLCFVQLVLAAPQAVPSIEIFPGVYEPVVGIGSCCGTYNVTAWIAQGNRAIDTSCDYGSQPTIGAAIRASGIPRSQFFITSKINVESCSADVTSAVQTLVLQPLEVDYVDLLLLHHAGRWQTDSNPRPPCFNLSDADIRGTYYQCRIETLQSFAAIQKKGLTKAFGVSNWEVRDLEQLVNVTGIVPAMNEIEFHPYWHTDDIISYCIEHGIFITAYAPYANNHFGLFNDTHFPPIAQAHGVSVAQVILRWGLQYGANITIPRSMIAAHMLENVALFGFDLTPAEMSSLQNLPQQKVYHTNCQPWC